MYRFISLPNWIKFTKYLSSYVLDTAPAVGDTKNDERNQAMRENFAVHKSKNAQL